MDSCRRELCYELDQMGSRDSGCFEMNCQSTYNDLTGIATILINGGELRSSIITMIVLIVEGAGRGDQLKRVRSVGEFATSSADDGIGVFLEDLLSAPRNIICTRGEEQGWDYFFHVDRKIIALPR